MKIELLEQGGVANLDRRLLLEDGHVAWTDRDSVMFDGTVSGAGWQEVVDLAQRLLVQPLKKYYGQRSNVSDPTTTRLRIAAEPGTFRVVEVSTDPSDPPPDAFWALIRALRSLPDKKA